MHVLITGGAGFIGQMLAQALLDSNTTTTITLTDIVQPQPPSSTSAFRVTCIKTDLSQDSGAVLSTPSAKASNASKSTCLPDVIFILHGIMSSKSEQDFELGMTANVDATRSLLEAIRNRNGASFVDSNGEKKVPRVIYTSSLAVYGPPEIHVAVTESTVPAPQSSYGAEKAICEILVAEYSRRGWIEGLVLRLPTISVRPGVPVAAASSFLSGIIREPLNGVKALLPVQYEELEVWLSSPRIVVRNLVHAATVSTGQVLNGDSGFKDLWTTFQNRPIINLPGITTTVRDMLAALEEVGGKKAVDLVERKHDPAIERIVASWPARFDTNLAHKLGFEADVDFGVIARDYKRDFIDGK